MIKLINDHKRMAELYGLLADGRELELLSTNGEWFESAASGDHTACLSMYIKYRVKPVTYSQALEIAIQDADDKANNTKEMYELIFDSGMDFQANREDK